MNAAFRVVLAVLCLVGAVAAPLAGHQYAESRPHQSKPKMIAILSYFVAPLLLGAGAYAARGVMSPAAQNGAGKETSRSARLAGAAVCVGAGVALAVGVDFYKAERAKANLQTPMAVGMGAYAMAAVLLGVGVQIARRPPQA